MEIQTIEYLQNEKSFLNKITSTAAMDPRYLKVEVAD